jgi:uncharacterized protein YcbK (DUF882 family)
MIRLKDNSVKVENLVNELKCKLINLANICKSIEGERYTMTITSAKDGKHMEGSKHYTGEAIDIRKFDMKNPNVVVELIREYLGKDYDVINEKTHIHIELDKKGGGKK